ncbi:helix-turn-helix domain-containing protein [Streptomyces scopuliridis]
MSETGKSLKDIRKRRGLSQAELSRASGVSLSTIRKLEQGERESARLETLRKLAASLRVPTMRLSAGSNEEGPVEGTKERWESVRHAIERPPAVRTSTDEGPTLAGLRGSLDAALPLYAGHKFSDLAPLLPSMLQDAEELSDEGRAVRVRVLQLAAGALVHTRQFSTAELALQRALDDSSNRMESAATINTWCWLLLRQGKLDTALAMAVKWADETEPRMSRATPAELSTWGLMLLRVSAAAVRNSQAGQADQALRLAKGVAATLGREYAPENELLRTFGPTTVRMKTAEHASVTDRPDVVLRLAEHVPVFAVKPTNSNRNRHHLDVAYAHVKLRQYSEAMEKLTALHKASPEWLPNQSPARTVLGQIIERRRTLTPEMRQMATAIHLEI